MISFYIVFLFFIIATLYSSIGFGGGSSYIALLLVIQFPFEHMPMLALICNLIVVSSGAYYYIRNKHAQWKLLLPFIITSIPCAFIGGTLIIEKHNFKMILATCLLLASLRMLFSKKLAFSKPTIPNLWISCSIGALLGLISGIVGIGGGIFRSPILYNLKWGKPKQISTVCCLFIFFNSIAGIFGQLQKQTAEYFLLEYWPLAFAVFVGAQLGSYLGAVKLRPRTVELTTGILIFFVSLRILWI